MNQNLQNILDIIQQNEKLSEDEKNSLLKFLKDADKELEITAFKLERTEKVKKTTAILLEETIEELEQKGKAVEAQNRELEIETALEKVRSSALAMKEPADMVNVCRVISDQLQLLGVKDIRNVQTAIINEQQGTYLNYQYFITYDKGIVEETKYNKHPKVFEMVQEMKRSENSTFSGSFEGEELDRFREYRKQDNQFPDPLLDEATSIHYYFYSIGSGGLGLSTLKPLNDDELEIFKRFHKVFTLAYRRFIDIEKAIAQATEAQIELALERVRARTMAMQKSDELKDVIQLVYEQFVQLNIFIEHTGFIMDYKARDDMNIWLADKHAVPFQVTFPYFDCAHWNSFNEAKEKGLDFFANQLSFEEKNKFYQDLFKLIPGVPKETLEYYFSCPGLAISTVLLENVGLYIENFSGIPYTDEENNTLMRFGKVFQQTYTRFLDLQKAEAQAREAIKQTSLDRVRGEIASMRTSEDLNRITPIIWGELKTLEVPFIRCGVFIVDEDRENVQVYLTTPDGKSLAALNLSFDANELTSKTVDHWRKKQVYKEHWDKQEFISWTKSMIELGQVQNSETYQGSSTPPESLNLHFVPFAQGMLYVGDISPLKDDKLDLVKTLAEAFSIAYARYEDFKNLEEAKNKIEVTLKELKSAQVQLIHSEKMASLGELTAGIAHEIKNPLNFVNNFSDLSRELIDDVKAELQNNNNEEVLALLEDLKQNLEKINQHGKRADSIVKGMLLHSRGSSGEKTLTDINDLLDQYVNLAYHGMRAQDKEFNISIEKDYDETLEKINIVPQDISRVFLNIINNACYAAYDKKKKSRDDLNPVLKVSTKNLKDKVEIRIGDNGNGIPKDILDKIFQPFFTTKPTGEGTGLGLSLSYDIITKVHRGEIKLESEEGKYTEFIINLPKQ